MQSVIERAASLKQITIANGQTVSGACACDGQFGGGVLYTPASFEGTTLTFQVSEDGTTFVPLCDDSLGNSAVSMSVGASRAYPLPYGLTQACCFKITSNQAVGADRVLTLKLQG